jgi:hypothetical protein
MTALQQAEEEKKILKISGAAEAPGWQAGTGTNGYEERRGPVAAFCSCFQRRTVQTLLHTLLFAWIGTCTCEQIAVGTPLRSCTESVLLSL